jgi:hypothetical protein
VRSPGFRRLARLFAALLLLWTAADLADYGLCVHTHGRIGMLPHEAFGVAEADVVHGSEAPDDCFCCSHVVDVRTPFCFDLAYAVAWQLDDPAGAPPDLRTTPLYPPPPA